MLQGQPIGAANKTQGSSTGVEDSDSLNKQSNAPTDYPGVHENSNKPVQGQREGLDPDNVMKTSQGDKVDALGSGVSKNVSGVGGVDRPQNVSQDSVSSTGVPGQSQVAVDKVKMESLKKVIKDLNALKNASNAAAAAAAAAGSDASKTSPSRGSRDYMTSEKDSKQSASNSAGGSKTDISLTSDTRADGINISLVNNNLNASQTVFPVSGSVASANETGNLTQHDDDLNTLKDVVAWTEGTTEAAVKDMQAALSQANAKVRAIRCNEVLEKLTPTLDPTS